MKTTCSRSRPTLDMCWWKKTRSSPSFPRRRLENQRSHRRKKRMQLSIHQNQQVIRSLRYSGEKRENSTENNEYSGETGSHCEWIGDGNADSASAEGTGSSGEQG